MVIKITASPGVLVGAAFFSRGEVTEISDEVARELVRLGHAAPATLPGPAPEEFAVAPPAQEQAVSRRRRP